MTDPQSAAFYNSFVRVHCHSCGEADYTLPGDGVCATCGNGTRPL